MEQIQTLSTIRGREILRSIYRDMRFERQLSSTAVLTACLRICIGERDLMRYGRDDITIVHPLGLFAGVSLWLQEIVNRFYFSTISSLVYLGAAILLLIVGAFRFTSFIGSEFVVAGIALEAGLLMLLFVIMFFSPSDDYLDPDAGGAEDSESELNQIVREIGEISSDYAAFSNQVDDVTATLSSLAARQDQLIEVMRESTRQNALMVAPQPQLLETMQKTNQALHEFTETVQNLVGAAQALRREEVERSVRQEVERLLAGRLNDKQ